MASSTFFNSTKLAANRRRAARIARRVGAEHHAFLHIEAAQTIAERLSVTEREFNTPMLLFDGPFSEVISHTLRAGAPNIKTPFRRIAYPDGANGVLDMEPDSADLIISIFDCQRTDDVAGRFMQINAALKPDGLFQAAIPVGGALSELQDCLMNAELALSGGAAMRFDLFPHIRQVGDMLQRTGFKLPVCDLEQRLIRYGALENLVKDLRGAGLNSAVAGEQPRLSRAVWNAAKADYSEKYADQDGRLRVTIAVGMLSGWKEHESQQKPLKPGSAKTSLKDFL